MKPRQQRQHQGLGHQESVKEDIPPGVDRGWAWMVCFGAHLCNLFTAGYFLSLGVFFVEWKEYFDASATASSWLVSLPWIATAPFSPVMGYVASRIGIRRVSMVGGALCGLSTMMGSLANEIWQLYLCSVLAGIAMAMILPSCFIILARYFKKRYALANGLNVVGMSVGQMIFSLLMRLLIANYGWRGAMLVVGALQLNSVAACALFRPLKIRPNPGTVPDQSTSLQMEVMHGEVATTENQENDDGTENQRKENPVATSAIFRPLKTKVEPGNFPGQSTSMEMEVIHGGVVRTVNQGNDDGTEIEDREEKVTESGCKKVFISLKIFTNIRFSLGLMAMFLYAMAWMTNLAHLPSRAKEAGWSEDQGASLLTVFAVVAIFTRSTHGWFVDRKIVGLFQLQFFSLAGAALATFLNPASDSFYFLVGYAVLLGACLGMASVLCMVIVKTMVREEEIPSALSWIVATFSTALAIGAVLAGKIYDLTGNYIATFITAGSIFVAALLLSIIVFFLDKRHKKSVGPNVPEPEPV